MEGMVGTKKLQNQAVWGYSKEAVDFWVNGLHVASWEIKRAVAMVKVRE